MSPSRRSPLERLPQAIAEQVVKLVVEALDVNALIERVDVDALVNRVDVDALVARVDADALLRRVDVQSVVDRVDPDQVVDRVDVQRLLDRVDVDALMAKVNVQDVVDRVDVDAILAKVDIDALVEQTELGTIIARSTSGIMTEVLDLVRRQVVAVDDLVVRVVQAVLRRSHHELPTGPGMSTQATFKAVSSDGGTSRQGTYAGPVSRLGGIAFDAGAIWGLFVLCTAAISWSWTLVTGHGFNINRHHLAVLCAMVPWSFVYFSYQWHLGGRTLGQAFFGIKVTNLDAKPLTGWQAAVRTLMLPVAIAPAGLGCLGVVLGSRRQGLFDRVAKTAVIYDWDAESSRLRWLAKRPAPSTTGEDLAS